MKTNSKSILQRHTKIRGSALVVVMVVCLFTLILVGSYLKALSSQAKIINRAALQNEARNAAEGVAEYALAEMHRRAQANPSFGATAQPDPLSGFSLSTADKGFIGPGTGNNHVVGTSVEIKNSVFALSPSNPVAIDGTDPVNASDSGKDRAPQSIRSMNIFAKASVLDPLTNTNITSYIAENVQIRDETWFNYAMFYNMDIEFHAGPNFTIFGPVFTNANVFATAGDGNKLKFLSTLIAFDRIYRYDKYTGNTSGGHGGSVLISYKSGLSQADADLKVMATTEDSRQAGFRDKAAAKWNNYVQDKTFPLTKFNPPGMSAYTPEDFTTTTVQELRNNAYIMIEPQLSKVTTHTDPYTGINDYGQKTDIDPVTAAITLNPENLKFSALSGFTIQVKPPASIGAPPQWQLICYKATNTSNRISADNPVERDSNGLPIIACQINPFTDPDDFTFPMPATNAIIQRALKVALLNAIVSIPYRDGGSSAAVWGNGTSNTVAFAPAAPAAATGTFPAAGTAYWPIYDRREGHDSTAANRNINLGMKGAMHVLRIDYGLLNTLINNTTLWRKPYGAAGYVYEPASRFTGVVYVQFPLAPLTGSTLARFPVTDGGTMDDGDKIRPAQGSNQALATPGYAVLAVNAGTLPQMAASTTSDNPPDGFTMVTNGPLYVWGHYNADGNSATGSATTPDGTTERPALMAADAVTILSANNDFSFQSMPTVANPDAPAFTEISAAIITGIVPTQPGKDNIWSGGVHNLIRYLENWNGTYRFRGSLAVLYQNEVMLGAYHEGYNPFYSPPTRDMGYHQYLAQGRFPPGTPIKRTVRRMNLQDITKAVYDAGPTTPPKFN